MQKMPRSEFLRRAGMAGAAAASAAGLTAGAAEVPKRPNILWLSCEDIGPHLGCYGEPHAHTPVLDALAARGVRYANAFTVAGVCAPNRSCIITGMYATTLGTHHMRSGGSGVERSSIPPVPGGVRFFPEYLREAGYYCTNNSKQDYQLQTPKGVWDESSKTAHWRNRPDPDRPFFAVFNYTGSHEGSVNMTPEEHARRVAPLSTGERRKPEDMTPPPFHPDTPAVRRTWAEYHELITMLDRWAGGLLEQLEEDGLADDTIVFFWSDHGAGMPRCKRWIYDSGVHVPLLVHIPETWRRNGQAAPGTVETELVSSIDLPAAVLALAGLDIPDRMQGRPFLGVAAEPPREFVYAARDRMDERYDIIRMVRGKRYKYIRNYEPFKPYDQFMNSAEKGLIKKEIRRLEAENALPSGVAWVTAESKPAEELYDTQADPHEMNNLAGDPAYARVLKRMREVHTEWMEETNDLGLIPEPELVRLAERFGGRTRVLPGMAEADPEFARTLRETAVLAGRPGEGDVPELIAAMTSGHPSIRYWAAAGLGYAPGLDDAAAQTLRVGLEDESPTVRVACARALAQQDRAVEVAVGVLTAELGSEHEWVRLHAALALDAIGEKARPAVPALKKALEDVENKYVVRVANRALNQMLGTNNQVR